MSSVQGALAKRVTNNYVVIPTWNDGDIYSGCYMLTPDALTRWASDNALFLSVSGNTYTTTIAKFYDLMDHSETTGIWNAQYYTLPGQGYLDAGIVLTDLGKDAYIGVPGEANILHLRLMQAPGTLANLGKGGWVGYVVVETNAVDIFTDRTGSNLPCVSVARI